jgi:thiamine-phosphate pyrophosphorylase
MDSRASERRRPILCLVTDRTACHRPLPEAVEAAVAAGVDWVQVRERSLEGAALLEHAEALAAAARRGGAARGGRVRVLVNRRVDIALAAGVALDGVHLGGDALPPDRARALLGAGAWIGVSTHAPEEAARAAAAGASYVQLAPIFAPRSKPASRPALGPGVLGEAARAGLPVLAQGGVGPENVGACLAAGAVGIAVTGAILMASNPGAAAEALREALDAAAV